jgi:anthranilate synthase component 1
MLLDLARNDVAKVSISGSLEVTEKMIIERYSHVMHIVSNVQGEKLNNIDYLEALLSGFPAGTVSGAPKIRAMEIIEELENDKREVYGGCVGYFSSNGAMDTCITLRTAIIKNNKMYVQAGGGIVADSDPESEYEETVNKAKALFKAANEALRFAYN